MVGQWLCRAHKSCYGTVKVKQMGATTSNKMKAPQEEDEEEEEEEMCTCVFG